MSTELRDHLDAVAERAPLSTPPADLWRRGRRRQVRRAVAGMTVAAVLAVVGGVVGGQVWSWTERQTTDPVDAPLPDLVLPDHVFRPGPWLAGTDDAGPIGPLVALVGGPRKHRTWWSVDQSNGIAGLSATGVYRYLDLPGRVGEEDDFGAGEVSLSPDGRYVAYWASGPTTDEPVLSDSGDVAGAVAVYDTVTGRSDRREISSPHGLDSWGIAWTGGVVRMSYGEYDPPRPDGMSSVGVGYASWEASTSRWTLTASTRPGYDASIVGARHFVTGAGEGTKGLMGEAGVERRFRLDTVVEGVPVPSPDGRLVAGVFDANPSRDDLAARSVVVTDLDEVDERGRAVGTSVPGVQAHRVYGWRDARTVVAALGGPEPGIYGVDIESGEVILLTRLVDTYDVIDTQFAAEAWQAPTVEVTEPRWPWDPRLKAGLVAGALLLVWALVRVWRRRRGRA